VGSVGHSSARTCTTRLILGATSGYLQPRLGKEQVYLIIIQIFHTPKIVKA
jgi:hypothetical protein